jgi:trehalose synthase-fused probable maltokinase
MAGDAAVVAALSTLSNESLLRLVAGQPWLDAQTHATSAYLADIVVAPWGDGAFALTRIAVTIGDDVRTIQLDVAARGSLPRGAPESAVIGTVEIGSRRVTLFDAVYDSDFRRGMFAAFADATTARNEAGVTWTFERLGGAAISWNDAADLVPQSAEDADVVMRTGTGSVLTLFRTLHPGVHPDLELSAFLGRAGFEHTPPVLGALSVATPEGSQTAGILRHVLPGAMDGFQYALDRSRPYFAAPVGRDVANAFVGDATRLGEVARAMHETLGGDDDDPAFAPEPASPEDVDRWAHRTQHTVRESLSLLERCVTSASFPPPRVAEAQALLRRAGHYAGWVNEIDDQLDDDLGMCIRVHGDFQLRRVVRTSDSRFMIADFGGDPSRPANEWREKTSPLRDVAAMLRSFAYAAAALAESVEKSVDAPTREIRSARWERDVRAAFLLGYFGKPRGEEDDPGVLPEDEANARRLILLFETERAFAELAFDLIRRPGRAWVPMRGISKLATAR